MPLKICPKCNKGCGPRTKTCECGHIFIAGKKSNKSKATKEVVGMGLWALDKVKGLPEIQQPEPLPKGKISNADIAEYVAYEGLGYCIYEYIDPPKIEDEELVKLWKIARKAMQEVQDYIYKNSVIYETESDD